MSQNFEVTAKPNLKFKTVTKKEMISFIQHHCSEPLTIPTSTKNPTLCRMCWDLCNRKFGYNIIPQSELDKDANLTG